MVSNKFACERIIFAQLNYSCNSRRIIYSVYTIQSLNKKEYTIIIWNYDVDTSWKDTLNEKQGYEKGQNIKQKRFSQSCILV